MAETSYQYTISTDIPSGKVDLDRLTQEIRTSSITIALDNLLKDDGDLTVSFKDILPSTDKETLDGSSSQTPASPCLPGSILGDHSGEPLPDQQPKYDDDGNMLIDNPHQNTDNLGNLKTASDKPIGFVVDEVTPNLADKTTWWVDALPVVNDTMVDQGSHTEYRLSVGDQVILDFIHGKLTNEDAINMGLTAAWQQAVSPDASAHPVVKVDGVVKTEDAPFGGAQGDYSVDYRTGAVTFHSALGGTEVVTVSCGIAGKWQMTIQPGEDQTVEILQGEVQWTGNIELKDSIYQDVEVWDEQSGTWVLDTFSSGLPKREVTKTIMDLINRSYGNYPLIPKMGGTEGRGIPASIMQVPFMFPKMQVYTEGRRVRIYAANNIEAVSTGSDEAICTITIKTNTLTNGNPGL